MSDLRFTASPPFGPGPKSLPLALACFTCLALLGCARPAPPPPPPVVVAEATPTPAEVAPVASALAGVAPDPVRLQQALAALRKPPARLASALLDGNGSPLAGTRGDELVTPASALKLLTAAVALDVLGPAARFTTRVVTTAEGEVLLVGGGDPLLASNPDPSGETASLPALAATTAAALGDAGVHAVRLGYDASLFSGPAWNPDWGDYGRVVSPTSALWVDRGIRPDGGRASDPAREAAARFAVALEERGVSVTPVGARRAPVGAATLAEIHSPALETIVERMLRDSDNDSAEVLFRQVGLSDGGDGSITAARRVVAERAAGLGLWAGGMRALDGSGLCRENLATAAVLARTLARGVADPRFRSLATGLAVAGGTGTLTQRFADPGASPARGEVRAKTGTLGGTHALVGLTTSAGGLVLFAFVLNDAPDEGAAREWLDLAAAALAAMR